MTKIHIAALIRAQTALEMFAKDLEKAGVPTADIYAGSARHLQRAIDDLGSTATIKLTPHS